MKGGFVFVFMRGWIWIGIEIEESGRGGGVMLFVGRFRGGMWDLGFGSFWRGLFVWGHAWLRRERGGKGED